MKHFILFSLLLIAGTTVKSQAQADIFKESTPAKKNPEVNFTDKFQIGVAWYPEQWSESTWDGELAKMQSIGINTIRVGEFAWVDFEPAQGIFKFEWMDKAIDLAAKHGIKTVLCTPTANVPPWLRQKFPDVLGANSKGDFTLGGRKGYNVNSKNYLEASARITLAMSKHFGNNKNIIGWQLDNEPGYPFELFDKASLTQFHEYLKKKYKTLDAMNEAWGGHFWSLIYSDWSQIEFPINNGDGNWNPGQYADYRNFFSLAYQHHLQIQSDILRQYIGNRFIFTNWPNMCWSVNTYETAEKILDITAWDNYSPSPGVTSYRDQFFSAMCHDIARCAGPNGRFLIAEKAAQIAAHAPQEGLRNHQYKDLAHGAIGTYYFEWRAPLAGQESGYVSMLLNDGSFNTSKAIHEKTNKEFQRIAGDLQHAKTVSDVALIYSYRNQWDQGWWSGRKGFDDEAVAYYTGLKNLHVNIDAISENASFADYKLIAAPGLRMVSEHTANRLIEFVKKGGILILNKETGIRDTLNRYYPIIAPGVFKEAAGITVPNSSSKNSISGNLLFGNNNQIGNEKFTIRFAGSQTAFEPFSVIEQIVPTNGNSSIEVLASVQGGAINGNPVITIHPHGKGYVVYVGTDSEDKAFYETLANALQKRFSIKPILSVPTGVEVVSRITDKKEYVFVLNYLPEPVKITLPREMDELISQTKQSGQVEIEPIGVRLFVLKR